VYRLTADQLRQVCFERGLDTSGSVRELRLRLSHHIKVSKMQSPDHVDPPQVKVSPETDSRVGGPVSQPVGEGSQGSGVGDQVVVLVELLRRIAPVSSEEPKAIMQLFVKLEEIHELGLVEDRVFLTRILPLVSGSLLGFVGDCL
jgi:hypothetical protein